MTVTEAAEYLGLSTEAVRSRIRRGTLPIEREGGAIYVLIDQPPTDRQTADAPRQTADQFTDRTAELIDAYKDQLAFVREQLAAERQGHAEARRLLAAALERIPPQIEAPKAEQSRQGEQTTVEAGGGEAQEEPPVEERRQRSWWSRLFNR